MHPVFQPTKRGFEHFLGYYSGAEEHFTHLKTGATGDKNASWYTTYDLFNNTDDEIQPCPGPVGPGGLYSSYLYGNETTRWISQHDPSESAFFYVSWNNVHDVRLRLRRAQVC